MKHPILSLLFLLFVSLSQAQVVTGVYKGVMEVDSPRNTVNFELTLKEKKGKLFGYCYRLFIVGDTLYYNVVQVTARIAKDVLIVEDERSVSNNFEMATRGIKTVFFFNLKDIGNDSATVLPGEWSTSRWRNYLPLTGKIQVYRERNYLATQLYKRLAEKNLDKEMMFEPAAPPEPILAAKPKQEPPATETKPVLQGGEGNKPKAKDQPIAITPAVTPPPPAIPAKDTAVAMNQSQGKQPATPAPVVAAKEPEAKSKPKADTNTVATVQPPAVKEPASTKPLTTQPPAQQQQQGSVAANNPPATNPAPVKQQPKTEPPVAQNKPATTNPAVVNPPAVKEPASTKPVTTQPPAQQQQQGSVAAGNPPAANPAPMKQQPKTEPPVAQSKPANQPPATKPTGAAPQQPTAPPVTPAVVNPVQEQPVTNNIQKIAPTQQNDSIRAKKTDLAVNKLPVISNPVLTKRQSEVLQTVTVFEDSITLSLYDNGEIDGDTVSVFLNNEVLVSKVGLTAQAHKITIPVQSGQIVQLTLYAENLGKIPPNTGLLVVYSGDRRYQVFFSATLDKSAVILLQRNE